MKVYKALAVALTFLAFCSCAYADVIYQNGDLNGTFAGAQISPPQKVTDSFTVTDPSTITSATVGLFVPSGEIPVSLTWAIGAEPFGTEYGTDTAVLSSTLVSTNVNGSADVYLSTFLLNVPLQPGEYWFTLSDAITNVPGDPVGWDINFGPSTAYFTDGTETDSAPSEFFRLDGTVNNGSPVPEPASLAMFGVGLLGLASVCRRKRETSTVWT